MMKSLEVLLNKLKSNQVDLYLMIMSKRLKRVKVSVFPNSTLRVNIMPIN